MRLDITLNTDDNYCQHASAMLCSLFENNKEHIFNVHILINSLSEQNRSFLQELGRRYNANVVFYEVDESVLKNVKFRSKRPLSKAAYYRILLSSVLDESIKKVLYLDCDMIVVGDVSPLFSLELENYALAASLDSFPLSDLHRRQLHMSVGEKTFCSGIMLINLDYWRLNKSEEKLIEYANRDREKVFYHDQDALNYVFKGKWFMIPPKWNRSAYFPVAQDSPYFQDFDIKEYKYNPVVIHYSDSVMKPWLDCLSCNKSLYINYLQKSGFNNVVFNKVAIGLKIKCISRMVVYWLECYVYPYLPNLLRLLIEDIKELVKLPSYIKYKRVRKLPICRKV